jgi:hypothetical protein
MAYNLCSRYQPTGYFFTLEMPTNLCFFMITLFRKIANPLEKNNYEFIPLSEYDQGMRKCGQLRVWNNILWCNIYEYGSSK